MKIAIVGPDGAGKSSVANYLHKKIVDSKIIYAGKGKNILFTTSLALLLWRFSKKLKIKFIAQFVRYFIYYPLEYFENLVKFLQNDKKYKIIYDRHPVDRMILLIEFLKRNKKKSVVGKIFSEWIFLSFLYVLYKTFFIKIDKLYFLLPDTDLCFKRGGGQYSSPDSAKIKIEAYRAVAEDLKSKQNLKIIEIREELGISDIGEAILKDVKNYG